MLGLCFTGVFIKKKMLLNFFLQVNLMSWQYSRKWPRVIKSLITSTWYTMTLIESMLKRSFVHNFITQTAEHKWHETQQKIPCNIGPKSKILYLNNRIYFYEEHQSNGHHNKHQKSFSLFKDSKIQKCINIIGISKTCCYGRYPFLKSSLL